MNVNPRVITLLSGKGGSGKSTVAISVAKLLADVGKNCLLVDFDLPTNGASYFFHSHLGENTVGIWEILEERRSSDAQKSDVWPVSITDRLYFMPSRSRLRSKGIAYEDLAVNSRALNERIIEPLLEWARVYDCEYVLIDCQSGYSIASAVAAKASGLAVIVTEADAISSAAADNLLIQLGDALPDERRYLVNKIDVRDGETYRQMREVFATLNRLPPLPFDFKVRTAFGACEIPVRTDEPSALLFALFETLKSMFPELRGEFESYRTEHVDRLFNEYNERFEALTRSREALEVEKAELDAAVHRQKAVWTSFILQAVAIGSLAATVGGFYFFYKGRADLTGTIALLGGLLTITVGALFGVFLQRRQWVRGRAYEERQRLLSVRIREVEAQLDEYRSLLWSQSKEYFLDDVIAKREATRGIGKGDL